MSLYNAGDGGRGQPDFQAARHYAFERLECELLPQLLYHSAAHTRDDVLPAAERLAAWEQVTGEPLLVLRTAAVYHDLGFIERYEDHEAVSIRIAVEMLPSFGYNSSHVERIVGIIRATRLPQSPSNLLEEIMADADLDILGREDFLSRNHDLRAEAAAFGTVIGETEWYRIQLDFMRTHRYWTAAARTLRDAGKAANIAELDRLLAHPADHDHA